MAGRDQQGVYQEDVPQPVVAQGDPPLIGAPNYDGAYYYHPPPPPVSDIYRMTLICFLVDVTRIKVSGRPASSICAHAS